MQGKARGRCKGGVTSHCWSWHHWVLEAVVAMLKGGVTCWCQKALLKCSVTGGVTGRCYTWFHKAVLKLVIQCNVTGTCYSYCYSRYHRAVWKKIVVAYVNSTIWWIYSKKMFQFQKWRPLYYDSSVSIYWPLLLSLRFSQANPAPSQWSGYVRRARFTAWARDYFVRPPLDHVLRSIIYWDREWPS